MVLGESRGNKERFNKQVVIEKKVIEDRLYWMIKERLKGDKCRKN